jgi:cardiolipin synthase
MGGGIGSIVTALVELLTGAHREIHILAYAISDGAAQLFDILEKRLRVGVRVTMIVQQLDEQHHDASSRLRSLAKAYPASFALFDFRPDEQEALHAKCIVSDRRAAFVGSANLSFNGLIRNHELGVVVEGGPAGDLAHLIEKLQTHPRSYRVSEAPSSGAPNLSTSG